MTPGTQIQNPDGPVQNGDKTLSWFSRERDCKTPWTMCSRTAQRHQSSPTYTAGLGSLVVRYRKPGDFTEELVAHVLPKIWRCVVGLAHSAGSRTVDTRHTPGVCLGSTASELRSPRRVGTPVRLAPDWFQLAVTWPAASLGRRWPSSSLNNLPGRRNLDRSSLRLTACHRSCHHHRQQ